MPTEAISPDVAGPPADTACPGAWGRRVPPVSHSLWGRGYVQVYTGDGKGKTTAALGLALRAAGAGLRVFIAQFAKGKACAEHAALGRFPDLVTLRHCGGRPFLRGKPGPEDLSLARECFEEARDAVMSGDLAVVILDEANVAARFGLLNVGDLLGLIDRKPREVELVITGRWANPRVVEKADLVTEMRNVKHYFARGVPARSGIDR